MSSTIEITATFHDERFRFENGEGDIIIGSVEHVDGQQPNGTDLRMYGVKGPEDEANRLRRHGTYRFFGRWSKYTNRRTGKTETQFHFQAYVEAVPASRAGIIKYIKDAGRGNGIGVAKATQIWDTFGSDAVRLFRESPDVIAAAIKGVSNDAAKIISEKLKEKAHIEHCSIELMGLLDRRGFPKATAKRALAIWGNQAADALKRNPYLLMKFRGCGFRLTDKMYIDLGHEPGRLKRQALCAWHAIASDTSGNTWYSAKVGVEGIRSSIGGAELRPLQALQLAKRAGLIETVRTDQDGRLVGQGGSVWIAESKCSKNEAFIARCLADAADEMVRWPVDEKLGLLTDHQWEHVTQAMDGVIATFGGSPGTGKTYTAAAIIKALKGSTVAVCAPTGKAAVRVTEAMQANDVHIRAKTIHSLLGVMTAKGGGWSFKHNESNPLDFEYIIVDESSMIDCDLMASLLAARAKGTHILFVGDVNQLPPVGHGAPLRDMIAAGIPYGELREIKRNDGGIVQACADIRDGKRFKCEGNLELVSCDTPSGQIRCVLEVCDQAKRDGLDPIWDVQVLVPVNAKSKVSRREFNKVLQLELNKNNPGVKGSPFRVGDKIVNTKNGYYTAVEIGETGDDGEEPTTNDQGEVYVANGELGQVVESASSFTIARLSNPDRTIRIPRGNQSGESKGDDTSTGCAWDLGYALSIHKSQGSEWPIVAVVLDEYPGAKMVFSREAVYTAISRAKQHCYLVGKIETAWRFCRRTQINERKTFLVERYKREIGTRMLVDL